jgi:hypothetical protein
MLLLSHLIWRDARGGSCVLLRTLDFSVLRLVALVFGNSTAVRTGDLDMVSLLSRCMLHEFTYLLRIVLLAHAREAAIYLADVGIDLSRDSVFEVFLGLTQLGLQLQ